MAITKKASAHWEGDLKTGIGSISTETGVLREAPYGFKARFEGGKGTNPEELIGAAHAACFSMALAAGIGGARHKTTRDYTTADVKIDKVGEGFKITKIVLKTVGLVPGIDEATFKQFAEKTKTGCPVSQALSATPIELQVPKFSS